MWAIFGRLYRQFLAAREVSCCRTLLWTPFSQCSLAISERCAVNNLFICSSHTWYSHPLSACWNWRCNSARNEKGLKNALRMSHFMWEGSRPACGFASSSVGSSYYKMWAGLNGFDPRNDLVLGWVGIGRGCMNLVTGISRYTWGPVTLTSPQKESWLTEHAEG